MGCLFDTTEGKQNKSESIDPSIGMLDPLSPVSKVRSSTTFPGRPLHKPGAPSTIAHGVTWATLADRTAGHGCSPVFGKPFLEPQTNLEPWLANVEAWT